MCRSKSDPCGQRRCPNRPGTQARQRRLRAASRMAEATGAVQAYIGATPFRPESAQLLDLRAYAAYYDSDEWIEYDDGIRLAADRHQLKVIEESRADGLWLDETEPAGAYRVFAASEENIRSWAAEVAGRYNQDAVMVAFTDPDGDDDMLTFGDMDGGISTGLALEAMRRAGVPGGRVMGGNLQIVSTSSDPLTKQQIDMLMDRLGPFDVTPVRAEFIEKDARFLAHSPIKEIQAIRQAHCERHNLPVRRPVPHLSEADDIAAAKTYDTARHQPNNRRIQRSYRVLRQHTVEQWNELAAAGYEMEPWLGQTDQPYQSSAQMLEDLRDRKHLFYYRTEISQGTAGALPPEHPMASDVTVNTATGQGKVLCANDVFRAVHDAFAHSEGHQFGPEGEKRAWWTHRSSLPSEARLALWNETRAQNCWTNAGPHMQDPSGTRLFQPGSPGWIPIPDRPYAEQKCVLAPKALI